MTLRPSPSAAPPVTVLRIHPRDNALVALHDLEAGSTVGFEGERYTLGSNVPIKHKFAAKDLVKDEIVRMYGVTVGRAKEAIARGELLTTANLYHAVETPTAQSASSTAGLWNPPDVSRWNRATFDGYHRANGAVGTANVWIVVPLVFCENRNLMLMKDALLRPLGLDHGSPYEQYVDRLRVAHNEGRSLEEVVDIEGETRAAAGAGPSATPGSRPLFPHVDGVKFLSHAQGCGGTDNDSETLCGLLAGYITHPNVAGATVLSLGCQKVQIDHLREEIEKRDPGFSKPFVSFEQQKSQSEKQMMASALRATFSGIAQANELRRAPAPLTKLIVGMECGASDGFSGISANPVVGAVSDRLAALKASVILSEFPELCGVEQALIDRCATRELGERYLELMQQYQKAAGRTDSELNQNPSYGNIVDGLLTGAMKSAGAALKGGFSPVQDVLDYPEMVTKPGLTLLCTPGNDMESTTAMAGAHSNLMLFTTGLGTPTGNAVSPVLKVSTNSRIARELPDMIDFDTGPIIRGEASIDELADQLLDLGIETASGRYQTCAQKLGQDDFLPWKRGVSL